MYEGPLLILTSVSIVLNILMFGRNVGWKRKCKYWKEKFFDEISPVEPPTVVGDPYDGVKEALGYDWEGSWD